MGRLDRSDTTASQKTGAKMIENSQAWLGASTSAAIAADFNGQTSRKPSWTQSQLKEAIHAVATQQMKFTQASTIYGIPKGTLYDNILGKSKRMAMLDEINLLDSEEKAVLDFCCETNVSPYNRRTQKPLKEVLSFVEKLRRMRDPGFSFVGLNGFRWWWAFCKKHTIVSLHYEGSLKNKNLIVKTEYNSDDES
ncbi:unnamed protein product [Spodoptera exigua]|nr:unnamed protein product [Spodoptera exigua]